VRLRRVSSCNQRDRGRDGEAPDGTTGLANGKGGADGKRGGGKAGKTHGDDWETTR